MFPFGCLNVSSVDINLERTFCKCWQKVLVKLAAEDPEANIT